MSALPICTGPLCKARMAGCWAAALPAVRGSGEHRLEERGLSSDVPLAACCRLVCYFGLSRKYSEFLGAAHAGSIRVPGTLFFSPESLSASVLHAAMASVSSLQQPPST